MSEAEAIRRGLIPPPAPATKDVPTQPPLIDYERYFKALEVLEARAKQQQQQVRPIMRSPSPQFKMFLMFVVGWLLGFLIGITI